MSGIKFEEPSEKDIFIPKFKYKIHFNLLHFSKVMKRKNNNQLYGGKFLWGRSIDRITFFRNWVRVGQVRLGCLGNVRG